MSPLNSLLGKQAGRPGVRGPQEQEQQPHWGQQPQAPANGYGAAPQGYAQQGYGAHPGSSGLHQGMLPAGGLGQGQEYQYPAPPSDAPQYANGLASAPNPYAPQFEPYVAPQTQPPQPPRAPAQQVYQPQAAYQQPGYPPQPAYAHPGHQGYDLPEQAQPAAHWSTQQPEPRGLDLGGYTPHGQQPPQGYRQSEPQHEQEPSFGEWGGQPQAHYGQEAQGQHPDDMGFAQPAGGELDASYGEEEAAEGYEPEAPSRFRSPVMIAAALAGAIFIGGGMAYGYKKFASPQSGEPPVVRSASEPSKIKPADAGGKQFAHADSKIMGRLGDGSAAPAAAAAGTAGEMDANGTRKVSTLIVGRDGSIQAPAADSAAAPAVPGMTVIDAGVPVAPPRAQQVAAASVSDAPAAAAPVPVVPQKIAVTPPQKPVTIAKAAPAPAATGSIDPDSAGVADAAPAAAPPPAPKKSKKVAAVSNDAFSPAGGAPAAAAAPAPVTSSGGGNGFVAVLASLPRSDNSRMDALKRFADMQQKYSSVLSGKTPDVAEANLGAKGTYHRLVVGPPSSREQANAVCSQLKSQGYTDCWVTSY
jgi:hypothetical protein